MIEILNWASTNPKLTLGILILVWFIVGEFLDRQYGERF